ncbi:hypothetical protein APSETT444_005786 [Aspergillus pseudonomiae]
MHIEEASHQSPLHDDIEEAKAKTSSIYENSKVRWKIDMVVLPIFLVTQALQFMDKTALNYANLFGYQETLGLKGQQFNYLSASTVLLNLSELARGS